MKRFACPMIALTVVACASGTDDATVDPVTNPVPALEAYLGVWSTSGDRRRQVFEISPQGDAVIACMMVQDSNGTWRVMARGSYQQVDSEVHGDFQSFDMGFDRMEVIGYPIGGIADGIDWVNTVFIGDRAGKSYETWSEISANSYSYVFEIEQDGQREYGGAGQYDQLFDTVESCDLN